MKFISKMPNLRIILRPGLQAQPITGTPELPTLYVQFRDGVAEVSDEVLVEKMKAHNGFNRQFISVEDGAPAPFKAGAVDQPVHITTEIVNGQAKRGGNPLGPTELKKANDEAIKEQAKALALAMLPELLKTVREAEKAGLETPDTPVEQPEDTVESEPSEVAEETTVTPAPRKSTTKKNK